MSEMMRDLIVAARTLFSNWRTVAAFVLLFDVLLVALYLFVSTREATAAQLLFTLATAGVALALFFIVQTMGVSFAWRGYSAVQLLRDALRGFGKLIVATLPVMLLGALFVYLFAKVDWSAATDEASGVAWKQILLAALWYLVFAFALPLLAVRLWVAAAHSGLAVTVKRFPRLIVDAFAPRAAGVYLIGLLAFAVVPYFLLTTRTPINNSWVEMVLLGLRLILAFGSILFGWLVTVGALSLRAVPATIEPAPAAAPSTGEVAV